MWPEGATSPVMEYVHLYRCLSEIALGQRAHRSAILRRKQISGQRPPSAAQVVGVRNTVCAHRNQWARFIPIIFFSAARSHQLKVVAGIGGSERVCVCMMEQVPNHRPPEWICFKPVSSDVLKANQLLAPFL